MGRMTPPGTEAWAGGTAADVAAAHRQHDAQRADRSAKLMADAETWVATQPELLVAGWPCHVAVEAATTIRLAHPEIRGADFLARVAAAREAHLRRLAETGWFTNEEIDRVLAGEGWPDA